MSENVRSARNDCGGIDVLSKKKKFVYTWTINNFHLLTELQQNLIKSCESPSCEANEDPELWQIDLYFNGHPKCISGESSYLGVDIQFDVKAVDVIYDYHHFYVYIIDNKKIARKVGESGKRFDTVNYTNYHLLTEYDILHGIGNVIANGYLTLKFELILTKINVINNNADSPISRSLANSPKLVEFEAMLCNKKFSDAKIIVGDKVLPVHKLILANRSPVFAAMFEHEMKESQDNSVEIKDFDEETMRGLLSFIYTGKVNDLDPMAYQLLDAANKYQIEQLKLMCEASLVQQLKVDNVIPLLMHAEMHDAGMLKSRALKFFKLHGKEVAKTKNFNEDFEKLFKTLPEIVKSLLF